MIKNSVFCLIFLISGITAFSQPSPKKESYVYACPPCANDCDTIRFAKAGVCPYCRMNLERISLTAWNDRLAGLKAGPAKKITVCFYLQDGVEVLDFAGPLEVFNVAGFDVFTVSREKKPIKSQGVLTVVPDYNIQDAPPADVVVVFGGATKASVNDPSLIDWLRARSLASKYTMSVCTGAFILAKTGLLDNLTATTYHSWIPELAKQFPKTKVVSNARIVDNGTVLTTAGVSAGTDGALHLVERIRGRDFAVGVAAMMEYDKWVPTQCLTVKKN
jgi:transcriptional regulator GlxA family with amidase domain